MTAQETREQKAAALRYKRPALADLVYYSLITGLYEITEEANNALYYIMEQLKIATSICEAYDAEDWRRLQRLTTQLPERVWCE